MTRLTEQVFNEGMALLAQSSCDLAERFGQVRTVNGQIALIREELNEVLTAASDAHRVEELCDLGVVCCGYNAAGNFYIPSHRYYQDFDAFPYSTMKDAVENAVDSHRAINPLWIYDCLLAVPNSAELFSTQVAVVVAKNAAKTTATHELNHITNKITRKAVKP